jgi:hypothetical protein
MYYNKLLLVLCVLLSTTTYAQNWNQTMKHIASIRSNTGNYGFSVAIDGNYAVVSALYEATDASGGNLLAKAGAAYVLQSINGTWVEIKKIVAPDRGADDNFGNVVSISGNTIVVAASGEDENENGLATLNSAGAVYVFSKDVGGVNNWGVQKKIVPTDRAADDNFGQSLSISGDNIIVGASFEDEDAIGANTINFAGSAYIFNRNQGGINNWGQIQKIVAGDRAAVDQFGNSVSISGDIAIVGAFQEDHDEAGFNTLSNSGSVYVFYKNQGGANNWGQVKKVVALDRGAGDFFGNAISISGNNFIVGAFQEDHDLTGGSPQNNCGSAYVFNKDEGGVDNWGQVKKLIASDRFANDFFGRGVSISNNSIVVGAVFEDEDINGGNTLLNSGSAYIFTKDQGGLNNWGQIRKITASDRAANDNFGLNVAINNDNVLVGSFQEDEDLATTNTITDAGAAYAFKGGCSSFPLINTFATVIGNQQIGATGYYNDNCQLLLSIAQQGTTAIDGHTTAKIWIDGIQNAKYVKRHVEINPVLNPNIATGRITLYASQAELNSFNAISPYDLPANSTDAIGISNIRIRKFASLSSNGIGNQISYTGTPTLINPADADIVWNNIDSRWEISFIDTAYGGYFIEAPPPNITATSNITAFTTCSGTPSANQTFIVNGNFLVSPITVTAPVGYEVSTLPTAGFSNTVILSPIAGVVSSIVYIRLNSATSGAPVGNITLTGTDANTINIALNGIANPPSVITTEPVNSSICFGNNASFSVVATGVGLGYQWQIFNGTNFVNITGATSATLPINLPPSNGNFNGSLYRCIATSICAPDTSNVVSLNISSTPTVTLTATQTELLPGQTTTLTATASTPGGLYTWYKNDGTVALSNGRNYGPLNINQLGSYKVTYSNASSCIATSFPILISAAVSLKLWVYPNPNNGKFSYRYFNQNNDNGKIIIYSSDGQKVYEKAFTSGTTYSENKVNISNQPTGIYVIAVTNKYNEILYKSRIVVSR